MTEKIQEIPMLATLPEGVQKALLPFFRLRELHTDEYLFFEGDSADMLYVAGTGRIKVLRHSDAGKDIVLGVLSEGDLLGSLDIVEAEEYSVAAQAMELSQVWSIRKDDYMRMADRYPVLLEYLVRSLAEQLKDAYDMIQSLAVERVERRIARVLLRLASAIGERTDEGIVIASPLTRQDIADMTGTTVETAIRVMSRFTKEDIIRSKRGQVTLLEPHRLVLIAEEA
jgi:CRP-like cAMP-binding protein